MTATNGSVACWCCAEVYPRLLMQEHHIVPQAAKGSDSRANIAVLCAGCHHNLHRLSELLLKGKSAAAEDTAAQAYPNSGSSVRRILKLSETVAREMKALREGDRELPERVTLSVELPRSVVLKLKMQGFEWNGSRPGLAPYIAHILTALANGDLVPRRGGKQAAKGRKATVKDFV